MSAIRKPVPIRTLNFPTFDEQADMRAVLGLGAGGPVLFGADRWDLADHPKWTDGDKGRVIPFERVADLYQGVVKMAVVALLNPPAVAEKLSVTEQEVRASLGLTRAAARPATAAAYFGTMKSGLDAVGERPMQPDDWADVISGLSRSPAHRRQVVAMIQRLSAFGRLAGVNIFDSDPWANDAPLKVVPYTAEETTGENRVQPNEACFDVLGFTEFFIEHCADSIIDLVEFHYNPDHLDGSGKFLLSLFRDPPDPDSKHANNPRSLRNAESRSQLRDLEAAARDAGWLAADERATRRLVMDMANDLAAAALFSVMFMMAMRPQDVARLDVDCIPKPFADGGRVINGWRSKNRTPYEVEFPLSARVERAVTTMKRLLEASRTEPDEITDIPAPGRKRLFTRLPVKAPTTDRIFDWQNQRPSSRQRYLERAADRLMANGVTTRTLDCDQVTAREMRRTALVAYASRELGHALAAEFGMWDSYNTMFGYVGNVTPRLVHLTADEKDSETMRELEERLRAARMTLMLKVEKDAQESGGIALSGNGVSNLQKIYNDAIYEGLFARVWDNDEGLKNAQPLTPAEVKLIGTIERPLYSLPHTYCHFDPSKALCEGRGLENPNTCHEGKCANSIMTPGQLASVEIRRRTAVEMIDKHNSAGHRMKVLPYITENFPDIEEEFEGVSNEDLLAIGLEEADWLLRFIVTGDLEEAEGDE